ncbi:tRNA(His) guanylyltransferase Thg1 family protein [Paenarthrobacter sp. DKR-5]|nr:tRNA(His) guanylyltransferase Thg1 family protein [Paenarthrobacter sp. DKR-5]
MTTPVPSSAAQSASVMKELERQYRTFLPAKSYAVIRVDGKGFA